MDFCVSQRIWNHAAQPPTGRRESRQPAARSLPCYRSKYSPRRSLFLVDVHRYESFKTVKIIYNPVSGLRLTTRHEPYPIHAAIQSRDDVGLSNRLRVYWRAGRSTYEGTGYYTAHKRLLGKSEFSQLCRLRDGQQFSFRLRQTAGIEPRPALRCDVR